MVIQSVVESVSRIWRRALLSQFSGHMSKKWECLVILISWLKVSVMGGLHWQFVHQTVDFISNLIVSQHDQAIHCLLKWLMDNIPFVHPMSHFTHFTGSIKFSHSVGWKTFCQIIDEMQMTQCNWTKSASRCNHIFMTLDYLFLVKFR